MHRKLWVGLAAAFAILIVVAVMAWPRQYGQYGGCSGSCSQLSNSEATDTILTLRGIPLDWSRSLQLSSTSSGGNQVDTVISWNGLAIDILVWTFLLALFARGAVWAINYVRS